MAERIPPPVTSCPNCGFSRLRRSRHRSVIERFRSRLTGTVPFRCQLCDWRGWLRDVWDAEQALRHRRMPDRPDLGADSLEALEQQMEAARPAPGGRPSGPGVRLWVDDSRPAPDGWVHARTVEEAQRVLTWSPVEEVSLDYDLGWCPDCLATNVHASDSAPRHCAHMPTGFDLCEWMAETGRWPRLPPAVHSGNLDGAARMRGVIAACWQAAGPDAVRARRPRRTSDVGLLPITSRAPACAGCGERRLSRIHRVGLLVRLRSRLTGRVPIRCEACGFTEWRRRPMLVDFGIDRATPAADVSPAALDQLLPEPGSDPGVGPRRHTAGSEPEYN